MKIRQLALVTGAAGAIGAATVSRLIDEQFTVIALDRCGEGLQRLQKSISSGNVIPLVCDLTELSALIPLCHKLVSEHGPISYLVNNAGAWPSAPLVELPLNAWDLSIKLNLTAPLLLMQGLVPAMQTAGGGAIVNVATRNAFRSSTKMAAYDAAKAGMVALTRTAAGELGRYQIRVNSVCPGVVNTPGEPSIHEALFKAAYTRLIPSGRYAEPNEIASVIAFLLSDDASYITGQAIIVDGGQIACQDNQRFMEIPHLNKTL